MEELKRFIAEGPSEQELNDAKTAYLETQKLGDPPIAPSLVSWQATSTLGAPWLTRRLKKSESKR